MEAVNMLPWCRDGWGGAYGVGWGPCRRPGTLKQGRQGVARRSRRRSVGTRERDKLAGKELFEEQSTPSRASDHLAAAAGDGRVVGTAAVEV